MRSVFFHINTLLSLHFQGILVNFFVALALISAIIASTLATDFVVGDEAGWKTNFDYKTWVAGK